MFQNPGVYPGDQQGGLSATGGAIHKVVIPLRVAIHRRVAILRKVAIRHPEATHHHRNQDFNPRGMAAQATVSRHMEVQGGVGEDADVKGFDFNEQSIRKSFVRKVYAILMSQLLVTLAFITLFVYHTPTKLWAQQNTWSFWVAFAMMFICLIVMSCCGDVRRQSPTNFIFLGLFTLAESFLLGVTSSVYQSDAVMMAVGITAAICLTLTIFAMQTKYDFTAMGGILLCATVVLLLFGLIAIFIPRNTIVTLVYASLGALLFSIYLIYDTQLMMGGKHKYSISPEEYVFAALNLYLDIINIFIYILTIIGAARD
ncbi:unnamed protein product [Leptosia nina]|uniref:Protein lifeguard 1 n=1 Tax=Leptosia nina TaxID=320188 RepID=A0AAV1J6X6_9NEOP